MLLSDRDILAAQKDGHISLDPWTPEMVQPASIDVRLDRFFRLFNNHAYTYVDPAENQGALTEQFDVAPDEPWILHPGEFALGSTWEYVKLDATVAARLEGKSSLGRLGILTHSTAGFIDPGFEGHITLELSNVSTLPVKLWPGMKIGQMCFFQLSSPAEHPYGSRGTGSHYQGQRQRLEPIPKFFDAMCRRLHDWAAGTLLCSVRCRLAYWRMAVNSTDWAGCSDGGRNP